MENHYIISDAARKVEVEPHVLRYWEDELELPIPRNEMGHRFYRDSDIKMLMRIRDLKEQGFQLRAIKMVLPEVEQLEKLDPSHRYQLREKLNEQVERDEVIPISMGSTLAARKSVTRQQRILRTEKGTEESPSQLQQFEGMMHTMLGGLLQEIAVESEQRISENVSNRVLKEVDYMMRQKEELQERQILLLNRILSEVSSPNSGTEAAAADEADLQPMKSKYHVSEPKRKRKLFAKKSIK